ncbi:hypothetical protein F5Y19DRAFT_473816 [Xylariaceae sp. FL1651]|nr:hypothetical protein F5Y19DRAFT_473816 [Xylariaceae sp. FL1651]
MRPSLTERGIHVDEGIGNSINPSALSYSQRVLITVFASIAIYNSMELFILTYMAFKRRRGLYFWSLTVATAGTAIYSISWILNGYGAVKIRVIPIVMALASWNCMVTGESLVLYSRLHLLYTHQSNLRLVLAMIITTAILIYIPGWVIVIGANIPGSDSFNFLLAYSVFERIQIMVFFIQEMVLSVLYLISCYRFWTAENLRKSTKVRGMVIHLMIVNLFVIAADSSLIYFEWAGDYLIQTSYKGFVYSMKLKIELSILTKLTELVKEARHLDSHGNMTRQLEDEWARTLERTIGASHEAMSIDERMYGTPGMLPEIPCEKTKVQLPEKAFSPSMGENIDEFSEYSSSRHSAYTTDTRSR